MLPGVRALNRRFRVMGPSGSAPPRAQFTAATWCCMTAKEAFTTRSQPPVLGDAPSKPTRFAEKVGVTRLLERRSVLFCWAIVLLVVWAFWPSYFSRPFDQPDVLVHVHALSQTLWCLLLASQAYAVRHQHVAFHRKVGWVSPLLVSVIAITTLMLMHQRMQGLVIADQHLRVFAFNLATLVSFLLLYSLAMYHRHNHRVHAGYMLCTAFPFFTAFVPRLLEGSPPLVNLSVAVFGSFVALSQAGLIPADIAVIVMSALDWRANRRPGVFPIALACLFSIHVSPLVLDTLPAWRTATEAFVGLPSVLHGGMGR